MGKLSKIWGAIGPEIGKAMFGAASVIATEAQISITTGAVSGAGHVPSRPGEPPNADSHVLADRIEISGSGYGTNNPRAQVISQAPYSAALEFGTSKMAARPFMRPAVLKTEKEVKQIFANAARAAARRAAGGGS